MISPVDTDAASQQHASDRGTTDLPPSDGDDVVTTVISAHRKRLFDFGELYRCRELLYFLTWRDIKVRYKQTVLGLAWAVIQPLFGMIVFAMFIGRLTQPNAAGMPYPLFAYLGLVPWTYFSNSVASASNSVVANQSLISKIYFPRLYVPFGAVGAGLIDFVVAGLLIIPLLAYYGIMPTRSLLLLPLAVTMLTLAAVGVGTWLSALIVAYRDVRHAVPFLLQLWMFATPCTYLPATYLYDARDSRLLSLNPAYGLIEGFRATVSGGAFPWSNFLISSFVAVVVLIGGLSYFRHVERNFADII